MLQVFLADILSTSLLIYFILVKPFNDSWGNRIQILNELTVLTCVWLMFLFSAYVPEPELRYDLAYYFLYFVGFDMAINIIYLVYTLVTKIYLALRTFLSKRRAKKLKDLQITAATKTKDQPIKIVDNQVFEDDDEDGPEQ